MKRICLLVVVGWGAAFSFAATPMSTNAVSYVTSTVAVTNTPTTKLMRAQCAALTKSGTRCKRNAAPGENLCRQHLKIGRRDK